MPKTLEHRIDDLFEPSTELMKVAGKVATSKRTADRGDAWHLARKLRDLANVVERGE